MPKTEITYINTTPNFLQFVAYNVNVFPKMSGAMFQSVQPPTASQTDIWPTCPYSQQHGRSCVTAKKPRNTTPIFQNACARLQHSKYVQNVTNMGATMRFLSQRTTARKTLVISKRTCSCPKLATRVQLLVTSSKPDSVCTLSWRKTVRNRHGNFSTRS